MAVDDVVDGISVLVTAALSVAILFGGPPRLRACLLFPFIFFVPGWVFVTNIRSFRRRAPFTISLLVSLTVLVLLSTIPVWIHFWHPVWIFEIESVLAILGLALGFVRREIDEYEGEALRQHLSLYSVRRLKFRDLLLPAGVAIWSIGIARTNVKTLGQYGLLPHLSPLFFVGIAIVIASFVISNSGSVISRVRMWLHIAALILMIFGTSSLLYSEPRYSWQYKLIGVVDYIQRYGHINSHLDIYQNWPGLFASIAWIDRVAGLTSPVMIAKWTQPVCELLVCIVLAFALRAFPLSGRERWFALGAYVCAVWIAQDYLSPQALGTVLGTGVLAVSVHWFAPSRNEERGRGGLGRFSRFQRAGTSSTLSRAATAGTANTSDEALSKPSSNVPAFALLTCLFAALVAVHELTPYVILIQLGTLTLFRRFRPLWLYLLLVAIAVAYLVPRFGYVNSHYGLLASIGNFFGNVKPPSTTLGGASAGIRLSEDAARLLSGIIWLLAAVGVWRRWRSRQEFGTIAVLAGTPFLVIFAESYGGEAILRVFLYSLPWSVCLVPSALRSLKTSPNMSMRGFVEAGLLLGTTGLLLQAFYGQDEINVIPQTEVKGIVGFYHRARPGAVFTVDDNYPANATARYGAFPDTSLFGPYSALGNDRGGSESGTTITRRIEKQNPSGTPSYVIVSSSMEAYAAAFGFPTPTMISSLKEALSHTPGWIVLDRSHGLSIFELPP